MRSYEDVKKFVDCLVCTDPKSNDTRAISHVTEYFNQRLKKIVSGQNDDFSPIILGCPTSQLIQSGMPQLNIELSVRVLARKKATEKHPFEYNDIVHFPEYIHKPIAVFRSATTSDNRYVVLTEMQCKGDYIIVIIEPNKEIDNRIVNSIRSIYPKSNIAVIMTWLRDGLMYYCDKQKILDLLNKQPSNSAEVAKLIKVCTKLIQEM